MLFIIILSFALTYYSIPFCIEYLHASENLVIDRYKNPKTLVPNQGGLILWLITLVVFLILMIWVFLLNNLFSDIDVSVGKIETNITIMVVISLFAFFGYVDDKIDLNHWIKAILPFLFAYPLLAVITPKNLNLPIFGNVDFDSYIEIAFIGRIELYTISRLIIMPIFVIIIANVVNMHSGFNGLQSGCSLIIFVSILIKSVLDGRTDTLLAPAIVFGSLIAFFYFNRFPSKIIEGNVGSFFIGATIGSILVIQGYLVFGIIIFIPHIVDFFIFLYGLFRNKTFVKYGFTRVDGTIIAPDPYKLKFLLPYHYKMDEKTTVNILHGLTLIFCIIGLVVTS